MILATGGGYRYYVCGKYMRGTVNACPGNRVPESVLDETVLNHIVNQLATPDAIKSHVTEAFHRWTEKGSTGSAHIIRLSTELQEVRIAIQRQFSFIENGEVESPEKERLVTDRLKELRSRESEIGTEIKDLKSRQVQSPPPYVYKKENLERIVETMKASLKDRNTPDASKLVRILVDGILVNGRDLLIKGKLANLAVMVANGPAEKNNAITCLPQVIALDYSWLREQDSNLRPSG